MKLLLTGFEPFGGKMINSSWETATRLEMLSFDSIELVVRQLPVSFSRVGEQIARFIEEVQPDVLLMLGQRSTGSSIDLERLAINMMDAAKPDNDGYIPDEQSIVPCGEAAYFTTMPVKSLRDALLMKGISSKISNSAGLYVCNCAYYNALHLIVSREMPIEALFVHIPAVSEEFTIEKLVEAISNLIRNIEN